MSLYGDKIEEQAQDMAFQIYLFFKKQTEDPRSTEYKRDMKPIPTTADAIGLPEKQLANIVAEKLFKSANTGRSRIRHPRPFDLYLNNLEKCEIKRRVLQYYTQYKKAPTVANILSSYIDANIIICTYIYFQSLLKELYFQIVNCNTIKIVVENPNLVSDRLEYLNEIKRLRSTGRPIIYVGVTYVCCNQKPNDVRTELSKPTGGFIVVHAGGAEGFVTGASMSIQSKFLQNDHEMNSDSFACWIERQLLSLVPSGSVIVMNNTTFNHTDVVKPAKFQCTRVEIEEWLKKNKVPFEENQKKSELFQLIVKYKTTDDNAIDIMIKQNGHDILRIPTIHYDLNPIEYVWKKIKLLIWTESQIEKSIDEKQMILNDILADYHVDDWREALEIVQANEEFYFQHHHNLQEKTEDMLKNIKQETDNKKAQENSSGDDALDVSEEEEEIDWNLYA